MSKWQPIETAPKDDTDLLIFDGEIEIGFYSVLFGYWIAKAGYDMPKTNPTHWMPLPEPPKGDL